MSDDLGCEEEEADDGHRGRAQDLESAGDALDVSGVARQQVEQQAAARMTTRANSETVTIMPSAMLKVTSSPSVTMPLASATTMMIVVSGQGDIPAK